MTGPESCGKTTLANRLAETHRIPLVPEVSRDYLNQKLSRDSHFKYSEPDLLEIASQQHSAEQNARAKQPQLLLCDTDLLTLIIWSEVRFGHCHGWILNTFEASMQEHERHYFLCDYHVPWAPDPLRESPDSRAELYALYQQKLEYYEAPFTVVAGTVEERMNFSMTFVGEQFGAH